MPMSMKIISAVMMLGFVIYLWPKVKNQIKNGPKGSNKQWLNFTMVMAALVGFVALLVMLVRSA